MKNIHILPTTQPSKLGYISESKTYHLYNNDVFLDELANSINIYITSENEDINENDYIITKDGRLIQVDYLLSKNLEEASKIILSTDPTLIADGVQAIDDEFLEWFVKNPTCEFVEVQKWTNYSEVKYKLIIPQEEPKQEKKPHSFCETPEEKCVMNYCDENGCQNRKRHLVEPHEQETLEEAAKNKYPIENTGSMFMPNRHEVSNIFRQEGFIKGAKRQAERMYSEEEVLELLWKREWSYEYSMPFITVDEWFEKFKKK